MTLDIEGQATTVNQERSDPSVMAPIPREAEQVVESGGGIERRERTVSDAAGVEHHERSVHDVAGEQRFGLDRASQLISLCVGIVELLIGARVLLKLIGANPANDFAHFVYNTAGVFLVPFLGLTGSPAVSGSVLEVSSLIAMVVYAAVGWGAIRLVWLVFDRPMTRSAATYDRHPA